MPSVRREGFESIITQGRIRAFSAALSLVGLCAGSACGNSSGPASSSASAGQSGSSTNGGSTADAGASQGGGSGASTTSGGSNDNGAGAGAGRAGEPTSNGGAAAAGAGGSAGGAALGGSSGSVGNAGQTGAGSSGLSVTKQAEGLLSSDGVTIVSYGGYLNGESFQQEGIVTYNGYQYAASWNTGRHVVVGRRALPSGAWSKIEFTDYTNTEGDAHNTISLGICPGDGTLHLSFDHHVSTLHYRKSAVGLVSNPTAANWATASFSGVTSQLVGGSSVTQVTYPRFLTEPDGNKMLFEARLGSSGSGDEYLWEYDGVSHAWLSIGRYIDGTDDSINAYPHGLSYGRGSSRLHISWCWRETPDATTNHDLLYMYSDDNGRTWKNDAGVTVGTAGTSPVKEASTGVRVWTIKQNRGLINTEHMAVDASGRVHVLLSHMPDAQPDDANFDSARTKSQFFHYFRNTSGTWSRTALGLNVVASFRGKLAIAASGNLYAILPDLRIAAASVAANFSDWKLLDTRDSGRFFSDPLIDSARLASEDELSIFYPVKGSPDIFVLDYAIK